MARLLGLIPDDLDATEQEGVIVRVVQSYSVMAEGATHGALIQDAGSADGVPEFGETHPEYPDLVCSHREIQVDDHSRISPLRMKVTCLFEQPEVEERTDA